MMDDFTRSYIESALFSSTDDDGQPLNKKYTVEDIGPEAMVIIRRDCDSFQLKHKKDIESWEGKTTPEEQAGHDFWLSRNGHGAGFWDGDWSEPAATKLNKTAKAFGECSLAVAFDGLVYFDD